MYSKLLLEFYTGRNLWARSNLSGLYKIFNYLARAHYHSDVLFLLKFTENIHKVHDKFQQMR